MKVTRMNLRGEEQTVLDVEGHLRIEVDGLRISVVDSRAREGEVAVYVDPAPGSYPEIHTEEMTQNMGQVRWAGRSVPWPKT